MDHIATSAKEEAAASRRMIVIDDDDAVRRSLQLLLQWRGYEVRSYGAAAPALADPHVTETPYLVIDRRLPDGDGLAVLDALKRLGWKGRAILITGFPSSTLAAEARARGYDAVLEKPLRQHELLNALGAQP
jgi:FixJ family two-component response regulator